MHRIQDFKGVYFTVKGFVEDKMLDYLLLIQLEMFSFQRHIFYLKKIQA